MDWPLKGLDVLACYTIPKVPSVLSYVYSVSLVSSFLPFLSALPLPTRLNGQCVSLFYFLLFPLWGFHLQSTALVWSGLCNRFTLEVVIFVIAGICAFVGAVKYL